MYMLYTYTIEHMTLFITPLIYTNAYDCLGLNTEAYLHLIRMILHFAMGHMTLLKMDEL